MLKLPKPPNNFGIQSVNNYCKKCNLKERLLFAKIELDKAFKILKYFYESKAPGTDDLSGIFRKDHASLLTTPITQLCNLPISSDRFPDAFKIEKFKSLFKKGSKTDPKNYRPIFSLCQKKGDCILFLFSTYVKNAEEISTWTNYGVS